MSSQRRRSSILVAAAIIIAATAVGGVLYLSSSLFAGPPHYCCTTTSQTTTLPPNPGGSSTISTTTSLTSSAALPTTNSTTSTSGLRLTESINASTITVDQSLNVSISILNTLPTVNIILPSNDWSFQGVGAALWGSCVGAYPVEVAVLSGNYTAQQLQSVANSTFTYTCVGYITVDQIIFQPDSDQANITGSGPGPGVNQTLGPFHLTLSYAASGYWNLKGFSQELNIPIVGAGGRAPSSEAFVPGIFTIAVEDEWGQAVVLHVTVAIGH